MIKKLFKSKSKCERRGHDWKENWPDEEEYFGSRYEDPFTSTCARCGSKKIMPRQLKTNAAMKADIPELRAKPNTNKRCSYDTSSRCNTKPNYDKVFDPNKFTEQWLDNNLD